MAFALDQLLQNAVGSTNYSRNVARALDSTCAEAPMRASLRAPLVKLMDVVDDHSGVQSSDKLEEVRGALAAAWTERVFGIVGDFLPEMLDFNGNKLQLGKDLGSIRLEVSMVPISRDSRGAISARDGRNYQPNPDDRSTQQRAQGHAAKAAFTSHPAAGSKDSGFDRKTDLAIAHLLLDPDTHPLYQCHVDEAVDSTNVESNVDDHLEPPLLALLDKVKAHQHLAPGNIHTARSALIDSWSERVGSRLDEAFAAMDHSTQTFQRQLKRSHHSSPALQANAGAETGLPAQSPAEDGASDSAYDDARMSQTPGGEDHAPEPEHSPDISCEKKEKAKRRTANKITKRGRIDKGYMRLVSEDTVRRPTGSGTYYSYTTTKAAWPTMDWKRQCTLSHLGRIEETEEGMVAPEMCNKCKDDERDKCMIYTEEARQKYHANRKGYGCAACRYAGRGCSFQSFQPRAGRNGKPKRKTIVSCEKQIESLKAQLAAQEPQQSGTS